MEELQVDIRKVLKSFELNVKFQMEGECLGILGASGCGKSMTLKAIAGLLTPDAGQIMLGDRVLFQNEKKINISPQKRRIGYLFQNYALFPNMTVLENITSGIRDKGADKKQEAETLLRQFRLEEVEKQYPARLSGGQQQRVALARILASKPEVLLLDEPFSAMDSYLKEELQLELHERLRTFAGNTILVSHSRDEIYRLCRRTMIMDKGSNLICDDTRQLFATPRKLQAARLTGCKNISRARRTGAYEVEAVDWGICLAVSEPVPEELAYVGIRAHDFIPADMDEEDAENLILVQPVDVAEGPFEKSLLFKNARNPKQNMWAKLDGKMSEVPNKMKVLKEKVLLLEK